MSVELIGIIITSIISFVSLCISLGNYRISKPKLKIQITDKMSDVYYGDVCLNDEREMSTKIGAVQINIINNSPVNIYLRDIKLKLKKNLHRLVPKNIEVWKFCYFFYDANGEKLWDGVGVNYKYEGFDIPLTINSYTIKSGICLFYDFPNVSKKFIRGKLILYTAVGKISKKIKFIRYDNNYISAEMKDVKLYIKNKK